MVHGPRADIFLRLLQVILHAVPDPTLALQKVPRLCAVLHCSRCVFKGVWCAEICSMLVAAGRSEGCCTGD